MWLSEHPGYTAADCDHRMLDDGGNDEITDWLGAKGKAASEAERLAWKPRAS
jgi:hypothetical protein